MPTPTRSCSLPTMSDHHVMTDPDAAPAATCGCGCGRRLPAAPAGGGRAPVYASRACQQRAYRQRQASAHATPAPVDPPSVADLIRDIRELAGRLDAGETIPADLPGAIRAGTRDLLARTNPTPVADSPGLRLLPAPTGAPSEDVTTAPPTPAQEETVATAEPGEGLVAPAPAGTDPGHTSPMLLWMSSGRRKILDGWDQGQSCRDREAAVGRSPGWPAPWCPHPRQRSRSCHGPSGYRYRTSRIGASPTTSSRTAPSGSQPRCV